MEIEEELKLVEKAKTDIHQFQKLYEYYLPKIYSFCLNRLTNREKAEDITSEVFLEAVDSIKKFDTQRGVRFGSWLYSVAHNKIVDSYRKGKRFVRLEPVEDTVSHNEEHDRDIMQGINQQHIAQAIAELHPRYQEIISLRYYSDMKNEEIAKTLGISIDNVAVLMHRALKAFKEHFEENYPKSEIYDVF